MAHRTDPLHAAMRRGLLTLLCLLLPPAVQATDDGELFATIIIDDLGYSQYWGERVIALDGPITCAVLPHSPNSKQLARLAYSQGKEVILHAPMANTRGRPLGPGAMTENMSELELLSKLLWNLAAVPYARGINNHMGSLLTQREQPMLWVMRELKRHQLFFIDSRTTGASIAPEIALHHQVPFAVRDVFLDHDREPEKIAAAFERLIRITQTRGRGTAIGHPYPETVEFLEKNLPRLQRLGIALIPASEMAAIHFSAQLASQQAIRIEQARAAAVKAAVVP